MTDQHCTCVERSSGTLLLYSDCPTHGAEVRAEFLGTSDARPQAVQLAEVTDENGRTLVFVAIPVEVFADLLVVLKRAGARLDKLDEAEDEAAR